MKDINKKRLPLFVIIVIISVILDIISKRIAISKLVSEGTSVEVIRNFFYFTLYYNTGAAWSSFSSNTTILSIISVVGAILVTYYYFKYDKDRKLIGNIGLAFICGGAIGNGIDRIFAGKVTDFLDFIIFGYDFPVFNVADSFVVVGVILFLIYYVFLDESEKVEKKG